MTIDQHPSLVVVDDDSTSSDSDSDSEEEEEPLLKYSTINPVKELLATQRDSASCLAVMGDLLVSPLFNNYSTINESDVCRLLEHIMAYFTYSQ